MTTPAITAGRLAPSPTGAQHVGNARTYLVAWLSARSRGGRVALRIEDIDTWRNIPGAADQAVDDLRWLGLDWDGEPLVQLGRIDAHRTALEALKDQNLVYPCTCTRVDILAAASAPHAADGVYPGTCAGRAPADAATLTVPFAWRFRAGEPPAFTDRYRGEVRLSPAETGGDFVVWRNDDMPAYQLAVVVDDAFQGITEVVRGDDLVPSTPRQLLLYRALGLAPPAFLHVPLVVGPDGRRLAKRHGDTRLSQLRAAGVSPAALVGVLAQSCGWRADATPVSPAELRSRFDPAAIPPGPFVLTPEALAGIGFGR